MPLTEVSFLLEGIPFNLLLFACSWVFTLILSVTCAMTVLQFPFSSTSRKWIENLIHSWNAIPHLLIVMFAYYGLPRIVESAMLISTFWTGVIALGIAESGFFTLLWIQAFDSIATSEKDTAQSFAFSLTQRWRHIYIPAIFRRSQKRIENQSFILLKETALTSVIGYHELMWRSSRWMADHERWGLAIVVACMGFMAMNSLIAGLFRLSRRSPA